MTPGATFAPPASWKPEGMTGPGKTSSTERTVDAVVVGGGPSGLSAATWIARYRRSVVLVDSGEYRSGMVEKSHGYLGRDPQRPVDLIKDGREELLRYPGAEICEGRVEQVQRRPDGLLAVSLEDGTVVLAHRLVLACGVRDAVPALAGFDEHYGASAFHCPSCDGYEARDRDVVCVGWDEKLVGFATHLLAWARSVTIVTDGRHFQGDEVSRALLDRHGIEVVEEAATSLEGPRGALSAVRLANGRSIPAQIMFFSIAHNPRTRLAEALGCELDEDGHVLVNDCGLTTVEDVYACGDLVPGLQLVSVAAASGVVAGVALAQSLFGVAGAPSSPPAPPDVDTEREQLDP